jgi:pimeloyl-ACP methyl ester carboxylesterase
MTRSNTAFFFIPGAFCPASYYDKVVSLLQQKGYHAQGIDLPSMDPIRREKGKTPGLYDDARHVHHIISGPLDDLREGSDVVLIASSYGSAVAFEACNGLTTSERAKSRKGQGSGGQLKHLVLLGALLAEPSPTVAELIGANVPGNDMENHMPSIATHVDPIDPAIAGHVLCGSLPEEERNHYGAMGRPICMQAFLQPMTFAAWEKVPTTLIIGGKDRALAPERQHEYFDKAVERGVKGLKKVVIEGGDHLPMLSAPEEVVRVCLDAAGDST